MRNNLIEEAHEAAEAIRRGRPGPIREEIGDLLFLSLFMMELLAAEKGIPAEETARAAVRKYREKHPHVYRRRRLRTAGEVLRYWQRAKPDAFAGIPPALPALMAARLVQERAAKLGFDWPSSRGPWSKIREEIRELRRARDRNARREELGDLLFSCVNYARHAGIDPELALRQANRKFVRRFRAVRRAFERGGRSIEKASLRDLDRIWNRLKP
jgi:MazG family protein